MAQHSSYNKIFGSGPLGLLLSLVLLALAWWIDQHLVLSPISANQPTMNIIFGAACLLTAFIVIWSLKSLPVADRGNKLCTSGPFKYVRHPLYAAFLAFFDFGLAFFLNSYVYLIWALLLYPLWHLVIRFEEKLMTEMFEDEYLDYQQQTGRFLPRLMSLKTMGSSNR